MVAAALPMLIGAAALAVDIGSTQLDARRLQGIADAAALAAAAHPADATREADAIVAASRWPRPLSTRTIAGLYAKDATGAADQRFSPGSPDPNAAEVTIETTSPTFLAAIFGHHQTTISRRALATRQDWAAFSIGTRLASLNGGLVNQYLSALTGGSVSLTVMDYQALAAADIDVGDFLKALDSRAGIKAATTEQLLSADVTTAQSLSALADLLARTTGQGSPAAQAATRVADASIARSLDLSKLVAPGPMRRTSLGPLDARVDAFSLINAILQVGNGQRQVAIDLGATVPGLTQTSLVLAIGERPAQSPWLSITDRGQPVVSTAQARLYLRSRTAPAALAGLGGVSVDVPIFVELAGGQASLDAIRCSASAGRSVTLKARTNPGRAALGIVDPAQLGDFTTPVTVTPARIVDTLFADVVGSSDLSLGVAEPWQTVVFDQAAITAGTRKTIAGSTPARSIAASLLAHPSLRVELLGAIGINANLLAQSVGNVLNTVAPAIDTLLMATTGALGVGIAEADLRVTGMRCGMPVLVG